METIENGFGGSVHDGVPASRLTGYRENLLIPQLWTGRRQLFHISLLLLRHSLIHPVLPGPMNFCRTIEPPGIGYRGLQEPVTQDMLHL